MSTAIYINFDGRCREAFAFYADVLGAEIGHLLTYGQSPAAGQVPADWQDKIINGDIELNGLRIAGGDLLPEQYAPPAGFAILVPTEDKTQTEAFFEALSRDGTVDFPLQETFWSPCYGIVTDQFGVTWKLNCKP